MTSFAGRRVMVVEDIFMLAMEVQMTLESVGVEVIGPFANSENALKSFQQRPPDCALLDVNLGEDNSFDLARALRMRGIPFLFFTGYDRKALPAEFADVERLEKPIDSTRLLQALGNCCRAAPS
jgi:CheY-like chemotaxis protein